MKKTFLIIVSIIFLLSISVMTGYYIYKTKIAQLIKKIDRTCIIYYYLLLSNNSILISLP